MAAPPGRHSPSSTRTSPSSAPAFASSSASSSSSAWRFGSAAQHPPPGALPLDAPPRRYDETLDGPFPQSDAQLQAVYGALIEHAQSNGPAFGYDTLIARIGLAGLVASHKATSTSGTLSLVTRLAIGEDLEVEHILTDCNIDVTAARFNHLAGEYAHTGRRHLKPTHIYVGLSSAQAPGSYFGVGGITGVASSCGQHKDPAVRRVSGRTVADGSHARSYAHSVMFEEDEDGRTHAHLLLGYTTFQEFEGLLGHASYIARTNRRKIVESAEAEARRELENAERLLS
ncbi:hypothetical protein Q5752_005599 [Cryptotrichosporon argae]